MTRENASVQSWQRRIFASVWITYFMFYFCRYNMPNAKTSLSNAFGWDTPDIGAIFSSLLLMYAVGQFVNGQLGDRFGTRIISTIGAIGSSIMNVLVFIAVLVAPNEAFSSKQLFTLVIVFWGANGFLQAMGWSPMVKVMTHWFPIQGRGKTMGWLGTCYQLGAAVGQLLAIFLVSNWFSSRGGDWRLVFLVPAFLLSVTGVIFFLLIRNRPEDVGLAPFDAAGTTEPTAGGDGSLVPRAAPRSVMQNIKATVSNPALWVVAMTFFLLDVNRYGFVNWLPAYIDVQDLLGEGLSKGILKKAMKICIHPLAGSVGVIVCGWATDRFFQGRRAPVIAICLFLLGVTSIAFTYIDAESTALIVAIVALIGFFTYGAHILMVGHAAQDFGHKEGAAGAAGFIDGMGYIGAASTGWGAGLLIKHINKSDPTQLAGYRMTFILAGVCALVGAALICTIWKIRPQSAHE